MQNTDQLFIRACKSRRYQKRIYSVYRRFYCNDLHVDFYIAKILSQICDKYLNFTVSDLVTDYHPDNLWKCGASKADDHWTTTVKILTTKIRLSGADELPGYRPPAIFRHNRL